MSSSPLGSEVLPPGPPTRHGRLQVRRCDSRRSLGLEPFVSPQLRGPGKGLRPPLPSLPERSPAGTCPVAGAESALCPERELQSRVESFTQRSRLCIAEKPVFISHLKP
ncbi:hypothetical protein VULLAG_LOCUS10650 [Vulpes lagopus]